MVTADGRGNRTWSVVEIGFYVLVLVALIFGAVYAIGFLTKKQQSPQQLASRAVKAYAEPAIKELKEMDAEPSASTQPVPTIQQSTVQPPPVSRPAPTPQAPIYSAPPAPVPTPQYQAPQGPQYYPTAVTLVTSNR